ncbi:putative RNA methyltransferase [Piscibacillus halophilus]|uniref:putative RNA methyltransferase n=1 Tax=Piscibacillus halophilus TaxID=571933 RepID=UPI0015883A49|nr:methyltransferase domain-containing protein [Piscibacillus halophilus]
MKKIDLFKKYMKQHEQLWSCPICQNSMTVRDNHVVCAENHSFDLAKKGYVNMMTQPVHTKYDKELFEARHRIIESGMYKPLHEKITELINVNSTVVDLGCGEGSHLAHIREKADGEIIGVGLDIAKEGVMTAAKHHLDTIWCVGDLAQVPFKDSSFDVVLNILSPANYTEFKRLLTDQGIVIKVVPNSGYLKELREAFYEQDEYDNHDTKQRFQENMEKVQQERITYKFPMTADLLPSLIKMTPLTWNAKKQDDLDISEVTIDLDILIGER